MKTIHRQPISAKIETELYNQFRKVSRPLGLGLQNFISKCMGLYITDEDFRDKVNGASTELINSPLKGGK